MQEKFKGVDIRVRVSGGGHVAQIYAIRQAISKALVSFYQKCEYLDYVEATCVAIRNLEIEPFYQIVFDLMWNDVAMINRKDNKFELRFTNRLCNIDW